MIKNAAGSMRVLSIILLVLTLTGSTLGARVAGATGLAAHAQTQNPTLAPASGDQAADTAAWPMAAGNPQRTSWTAEEVTGNLHVEWYRPIEAYIPQNAQVIAANGLLYVATARGLYALNAATGQTAWRYDTELPLGNSPTLATVNGVALAFVGGFDRKLHALNALTGSPVWEFSGAAAGYDTNPLVINNTVYLGNRDGRFYAVDAASGALVWQYPAAGQPPLGPIDMSASYKNGVLYFAANDNYAYALNTDGSLKWRSASRLGGDGFHSYWPVVFTDPGSGQDYVIFAAASGYRAFDDPGQGSLACASDWCEWEDEFNGRTSGNLGPVVTLNDAWAAGKTIVDYSGLAQYFEDNNAASAHAYKPWRRFYYIFNAGSGAEWSMDTDHDGRPEYAPIDPILSNSGNPYPPIADGDGLLYMGNHYEYNGQSRVMGWRMGTPYLAIVGLQSAGDEPEALSFGGSTIYRSLCCDRVGDWANAAGGGAGSLWVYDLSQQAPGYDQEWWFFDPNFLSRLGGNYGNINGIYHSHGDQNPLVPYAGRLYIHRSNAIIAYGPNTPLGKQPLLTAASAPSSSAPLGASELQGRLEGEVQKMLAAGHLRPGYYNAGQFNQTYPELADYFANPGDTLYTLALAYPYLSPASQGQVKTYLAAEFAGYFDPNMYAVTGWAGASREALPLPNEVSADLAAHGPAGAVDPNVWSWTYPQPNFYALWKYAQIAPEQAGRAYSLAKGKLQVPAGGNSSFYQQRPWVLNGYIAGYTGFLKLQELAGATTTDSALRGQVQTELNRLLQLRVSSFAKDSPWVSSDGYTRRVLNVSRNFIFLVPELAAYLRQNALPQMQAAIAEYQAVGPHWFVSRYTASIAESTMQNLYDYPAIFQAKAYILGESQEALTKYLDVPAFARGDLFYMQNLVAALQAPASGAPTVPPKPTIFMPWCR